MGRRLVYLGTPDVGVAPLRALHDAGHEIALVVTQPDRRRGRGGRTAPTPVKAAAEQLGLAVSHRVADVVESDADLGVVVAFGRLIKPDVLAAVPMINMHFSLLPRWRGAAPVERALLAGDATTGVCIMDVGEGLDTGAVYARAEVPIGATTTADDLRRELTAAGTRLLVDLLAGDLPEPQPQRGEATYADKLTADEWRLDWSEPAIALDRWVRAGPAFTTFRGKRLRIAAASIGDGDGGGQPPGMLVSVDGDVATGAGVLVLHGVQPEGKAPMAWRDFANGARPEPGERLGD